MAQAEEDSPQEHQERELQVFRSEEFVKVYANNVQIETSIWDCRLTFGELTKATDGKPSVEQLVTVVMSPQHAKALVGVLAGNLQQYEKQVGEIKLPSKENMVAS